jgi:3-oxoadipate enol-lactonase
VNAGVSRTVKVPAGDLVVRDVAGPPGAPTVVLIHGWTATADANFGKCYEPLARDVRVVAFDQRGHGTGLRPRRPFRLADCADDVADVATALGIERFVPVGYSMGGAIAQLVWRRHTDRVAGLVLCATAGRFGSGPSALARSAGLGGLAAVARVTPPPARRWASDRLFLERKQGYWEPWAIEAAADHAWRTVLEAGAALGTFRSDPWIGDVDVPTAVVIPEEDHVIPPAVQRHLAASIPRSVVFPTPGNHLAAATSSATFVPTLRAAVASVLARGERVTR